MANPHEKMQPNHDGVGKRLRPDRSPFADVPIGNSPGCELAIFLENTLYLYEQDQTTAIYGFDAISKIMATYWKIFELENKSPDPQDLVTVPWWVVELIGEGFKSYIEDYESGSEPTIGQAFNIEKKGQGNRPVTRAYLNQLRDIRIALSIAGAQLNGERVGQVIKRLSGEWNRTPDQLRGIWKKHRKHARTMVSHYRKQMPPDE